MHIIYRIINNITRKFYIGRTSKTLSQRWSNHKYNAKSTQGNNNGSLQKSLRKYGIESFDIKEIDRCESFKDAVRLELFYIKYYNSENPKYGYNLTHDHGDGYESMSESSRKILSISLHNRRAKKDIIFDKARNKWVSKVEINGKLICKRFAAHDEAKRATDVLNIIKFGASANLYFPRESYSDEFINSKYLELQEVKKPQSKFIGVTYTRKRGVLKYTAEFNRGLTYCGTFTSEEEAAKAHDICEYYISKSFLKINFPEFIRSKTFSDIKKEHDRMMSSVKANNILAKKTSNYHHVQLHNKKWRFFLVHNGKQFQSKVFPTELEAAQAYNEYATILLGEKAELNNLGAPPSSSVS